MSRSTSISAYAVINESGLLGELQLAVYNTLVQHGSHTAHEVWNILKEGNPDLMNKKSDGITPRFSELKKKGVVAELPKRKCNVTGMQAIEWCAVDGLPIKIAKTKLNKDKIADMQEFIKTRLLWEDYVKEFGE